MGVGQKYRVNPKKLLGGPPLGFFFLTPVAKIAQNETSLSASQTLGAPRRRHAKPHACHTGKAPEKTTGSGRSPKRPFTRYRYVFLLFKL